MSKIMINIPIIIFIVIIVLWSLWGFLAHVLNRPTIQWYKKWTAMKYVNTHLISWHRLQYKVYTANHSVLALVLWQNISLAEIPKKKVLQ